MSDERQAYIDAVEREQNIRDAAFLGLPERVGSFDLRPMTVKDYLTLVGIGSPFVSGGLPNQESIGVFLWYQSTDYDARDTAARAKFYRRVIKEPLTVINQIYDFCEAAMQDKPATSKGAVGPSYYSWVATVINTLAHEYSWTDEYILGRPLKVVWQYYKCIKHSHGGDKAILHNPSDRQKFDLMMANKN